MRDVIVFNSVSLDGYFVDATGDMSWAHSADSDAEFRAFSASNAGGEGELLFGRVTYDLMVGYWTSPAAQRDNAETAKGMNAMPKVVFSRKLDAVSWNNTRLVSADPVGEVRRMKSQEGGPLVILGSGSLVAQLAAARLVDHYQFVVVPVVLGAGRTLFEGIPVKLKLTHAATRTFMNGKVLLSYRGP